MQIYLVGGAIRNKLLNIPITDKDWVVVGSTDEQMIASGYQKVSKNFPVFLHPKTREEYALARTERKNGTGYTGFITQSSPSITLEEDLKRRDLTINAIAQDKNGLFIDPYNGIKDINNRLLRHVSDAFIEEPLRILRIARFAAQFSNLGFKIAKETQNLMLTMVKNNELKYICPDRIWKETEKALKTNNPHIFFLVLYKCGALKIIFPEINNLFEVPIYIKYRSEINNSNCTLMTLKITSKLSSSISVRFASLCYEIGKSLTLLKNFSNDYKYKNSSTFLIKNMFKRLCIPNVVKNLSIIAAEFYDIINNIEYQSASFLISFFNKIDVWRKPNLLDQLLIVSKADAKNTFNKKRSIYYKSQYLRDALLIAKSVTSKSVINDGFHGSLVKDEIIKRRINLINLWILKKTK